MKWNGFLTLSVCLSLACSTAFGAEPIGRNQPNSLRRTAAQPVAHTYRNAEPTPAIDYNTPGLAPSVDTGTGMAGAGAIGGTMLIGGLTGGYGWARDMSGWNTCDYTAPCTSHLWDGYVQRPHRCNTGHFGHGGCGSCGGASARGQSACGCGAGGCQNRYHQCRIFGKNGGGSIGCTSCSDPCASLPGLGCTSPVEYTPAIPLK